MAHSAMQFNTNALYQLVTQVGHEFAVGEVIRFDGTEFVLASSLAEATASIVGMVSGIETVDQFYFTEVGFISGITTTPTEGGAFVPGTQYYLSNTDGELTSISPAIEVPCFIAYTANSGFFIAGIGSSGGAFGANTALSNLTATGINQSLISGLDDTDNLGSALRRWADLYAVGIKTGETIGDDLILSARDVDGAVDKNFITLTAGDTPTCVLNGDITSTTQAPLDSSLKIATTEYVDDAVTASSGANVQLSNLAGVAVNTSLVSDADITDDLGSPAIRWDNVYAQSISTGDTNGDALTVSGYDVDGAAYVDFLTVTAGNTPTAVLNGSVTTTTQAAADGSTKLASTAYADRMVPLAGGTMTGDLILNADPTNPLGAVTKQYADAIAAGIDIKDPAYAATTAALTAAYANGASGVGATLTNSGAQAAFSVDGVSPPINSRILVKNQASTFENGIYTLTTVGTGATNWVLTRATDYDTTAEISTGDLVIVENGTANAVTSWLQTATVATIGTDAITFVQFSGAASGAPTDATYITQTPNGSLSNEQALSVLATGILKSTTATGVVSTAVAGTDYADPAVTMTINGTPNEISSSAGAQSLAANRTWTLSLPTAMTYTGKTVTGGTFTAPTINVNDNAFSLRDNGDTTKIAQFECSGITTGTTRTYTFQDANGTLYQSGGTDIPVTDGGTGVSTLTTAYGVLCAGTTATGNVQTLASLGASGEVLTSNGAGALPSFQAAAGGSGFPQIPTISAQWYACPGIFYNPATPSFINHTTGTLWYVPFIVTKNTTYTDIGLQVGTTAAGNINMGIYADSGSMAPTGSPITNSTSGSVASSASSPITYTFGTPIALTAGVYWLAFTVSDTNNLGRNGSTVQRNGIMGCKNATLNIAEASAGYRQTFVYSTTLPAASVTVASQTSLAGTGDVTMALKAQ